MIDINIFWQLTTMPLSIYMHSRTVHMEEALCNDHTAVPGHQQTLHTTLTETPPALTDSQLLTLSPE